MADVSLLSGSTVCALFVELRIYQFRISYKKACRITRWNLPIVGHGLGIVLHRNSNYYKRPALDTGLNPSCYAMLFCKCYSC